jgi:hypothetical protein
MRHEAGCEYTVLFQPQWSIVLVTGMVDKGGLAFKHGVKKNIYGTHTHTHTHTHVYIYYCCLSILQHNGMS